MNRSPIINLPGRRSVYIIGGAGAGKSTFTEQLVENLGSDYGPLEELHKKANPKNIVTLRGHRLAGDGIYLGIRRDQHPGTDGLDRASSPVGEEWLVVAENLPKYIIAEGKTLATRRFLSALHNYTQMILIHLTVGEEARALRFAKRGTNQDPIFVAGTVTVARNALGYMREQGCTTFSVDSDDLMEWELALDLCQTHLVGKFFPATTSYSSANE